MCVTGPQSPQDLAMRSVVPLSAGDTVRRRSLSSQAWHPEAARLGLSLHENGTQAERVPHREVGRCRQSVPADFQL